MGEDLRREFSLGTGVDTGRTVPVSVPTVQIPGSVSQSSYSFPSTLDPNATPTVDPNTGQMGPMRSLVYHAQVMRPSFLQAFLGLWRILPFAC